MRRFLTLLVTLVVFGVGTTLGQVKQVTGIVTSADDKQPIPGVNITIKEVPGVGVVTDIDGKFTLKNVPTGAKNLVVSFIGYTTQVLPLSSSVNIVLAPDNKKIDEVVVVGYGVVKKSELTGSVSSIKSDDLLNKPVANVTQAIQGKVPGVQVVSTNGRTGDATQISVRGNGSLSASNSVLYVIDGVQQESMSSISPNDIESIEILKDAASTAIYGSRASNGVVLIQTKKGKLNSKSAVTVSSYFGLQDIVKKPKMLNAAEYKNIHDVARVNFEKDLKAGLVGPPKDPNSMNPMPASSVDTDWFDLILRNKSYVQNHQISLNGGNESTKVYLSGSMYKQDGVVKMDEYKAFRGRLNVDHKLNQYVKVGVQSFFNATESIPLQEDNDTYTPWKAAQNAHPNVAPYDSNGKIARYSFINPLFAFEREISNKWQRLGGTFFFDVTPISGLVWHSAYSGNLNVRRYNRYDAPNTRRGENGSGVPFGYGYYSSENNRDYQVENTFTYSKSLLDNKLKFTLLAGHSFQNWMYEDCNLSGENFPSSDLKWLVSAGTVNKGRSYYYATALESYFSRFQFSWDGKYNMMVSMRRDGSSKFSKENRWGSFPAISAGWNISNEKFFKVPYVSTLKLRASFGYTGNQSGVDYSIGQNLIGSGYNHNGNPGLATAELYNPNLHWEKGQSLNVGFDLGLFKDRASISVDIYNKTTKDLLYRVNVVQETGFASMMSNDGGKISNKGIEVDAKFDIIKTNDLFWSLGANFSYNKNKVVELGNPKGYYTTGFVSVVKEGESLGSFFLPEAIGIAQQPYQYKNKDGVVTHTVLPGDMIYRDVNGDGLIDDADRVVISGGIAPVYGGINTKVEYQGVDFSLNSQFALGKKIYAMYKEETLNGGVVGSPSFSNNMTSDMNDYWSESNRNASNPRPHLSTDISGWNLKRSTRFVEDGDYLRITDVTLGYNFKHFKIPFLKSLRVYVQARNPFTFTKYKGLDPETEYVDPSMEDYKTTAGVDIGGIPNIKSFIFGLNINL